MPCRLNHGLVGGSGASARRRLGRRVVRAAAALPSVAAARRKGGGQNVARNLVTLCRPCHGLAHSKRALKR